MTRRSLDAELVARARRVLAAASVVSEATTSSPDQAKVRSAPGSTPPAGDGDSLFHRFIRIFLAAGDDEDKLRDAVHRAETDLAAYRRAKPVRPPETADERDARIVRDYEGLTPVEAARLENVSAENIRRVRFAAGRDTRHGEKRQYGWKTVNERRVLAMQFASVGWTARRIAAELGVSHTQIQRDLRTDQTEGAA